ncbi:hypothetical protein B296_00019094 [Ensete ventricosum]|uniref:Uncharacterized protein n=1 Tax=Ensete ventricosum TaxID=4639 RepID=A0A427B0Y0_ENSVE|nr:hypothetical protein B296_00019094 [Ensete ventricosum]
MVNGHTKNDVAEVAHYGHMAYTRNDVAEVASDKVKISNRHKSQHREEGSKSHASKGKEQVGVASEAQTPRPRRPKSIKDLCITSTGEGEKGYYALRMTDLPPYDLKAPLEARWSTLKQGTRSGWTRRLRPTQLRARYPELEIEEDPFKLLIEDSIALMEADQPFDNSLPPPKER